MSHPTIVVDPISGVAPLTVTVSAHDSDGDQFLGSIDWDWGDLTPHGSGTSSSHTYTIPGSFNLICTSQEGDFTQTVMIVAYEPPPVAVNDTFTVIRNSQLQASVADNDAPGPNLLATVWSVVTGPLHGTISAWPGNGSFVYTPATNYHGSDSFTYQITNNNTSATSTATVNITITPGVPSLLAWWNGKQVYLGLPSNSLVFDGNKFVPPDQAKYVAIVETATVSGDSPPLWPESQSLVQVGLTWKNVWLCRVIATNQQTLTSLDVVAINDPNNGACVCGVTCVGTELQYVQVTTAS